MRYPKALAIVSVWLSIAVVGYQDPLGAFPIGILGILTTLAILAD